MSRYEDEAMDAARLAAMVGGQLKQVDQMRTDNGGLPANKININSFIAKVKGKNAQQDNQYPAVTPLQQRAMEDAMRQAEMIPEPPQFLPDIASQLIPLPSNPIASQIIASDSLKNIEEKIEKIGISLDSLLQLVQKTLNQNE
jgi:hypothetical protein